MSARMYLVDGVVLALAGTLWLVYPAHLEALHRPYADVAAVAYVEMPVVLATALVWCFGVRGRVQARMGGRGRTRTGRLLFFAFLAYFCSLADDNPVNLDSVFTWPEVTSGLQHTFLEILLHVLTLGFMLLALREASEGATLTRRAKVKASVLVLAAFWASYAQNTPLQWMAELAARSWYPLDVVEHVASLVLFYLAVRVALSGTAIEESSPARSRPPIGNPPDDVLRPCRETKKAVTSHRQAAYLWQKVVFGVETNLNSRRLRTTGGSGVDSTDIALSLLLMSNSRIPYSELAGKLGLSINAVHRRIMAMVGSGLIRAFTARPSLPCLNAVGAWVFGRSEAAHPEEVHLRLKNNDATYWVANSGGGYVYVGCHLKSASDLDSYVAFTRREAEIYEPTVGILWQPANRFPNETLQPLDYQILSSLHRDSRKSVTEVASEVRASAKTVHRRLERMVEKGLADLSIDWYPDSSNDIIALCHVTLAKHADRASVLSSLKESLPQNILVDVVFSNLPGQFAEFLWANTMKQMYGVRERVAKVDGVESVTLNVIQIGYMFDTWRDGLLPSIG